VSVLVWHYRSDEDADSGRGGRPPDSVANPGNRVPARPSSVNPLVRKGAACWVFLNRPRPMNAQPCLMIASGCCVARGTDRRIFACALARPYACFNAQNSQLWPSSGRRLQCHVRQPRGVQPHHAARRPGHRMAEHDHPRRPATPGFGLTTTPPGSSSMPSICSASATASGLRSQHPGPYVTKAQVKRPATRIAREFGLEKRPQHCPCQHARRSRPQSTLEMPRITRNRGLLRTRPRPRSACCHPSRLRRSASRPR
jgi:hypothetical protein